MHREKKCKILNEISKVTMESLLFRMQTCKKKDTLGKYFFTSNEPGKI